MTKRLFGTDGIRALANRELTPALALKLGECAGQILGDKNGVRKRAIIGYDTRKSGQMLTGSLAAGLASAGFDVIIVGTIPTPGLAYLTRKLGVDLGAMISASHNYFEDNGIKFFNNQGYKLSDAIEDEIEQLLKSQFASITALVSPLLEAECEQRTNNILPQGDGVGNIKIDERTAVEIYEDYLQRALCRFLNNWSADCGNNGDVFKKLPDAKIVISEQLLQGLSIVIDSANGAASDIAPVIFRKLGANITTLNDSPDGKNINFNAGSTHPKQLKALVDVSGADLGIAYDGDADRCLAIDNQGNLVDGDHIMAVLAEYMMGKIGPNISQESRACALPKNSLVATVMSNQGFINSMKSHGIKVLRANVGDRYVLEMMKENGVIFGGEQSGHIINLNLSTTGDGILTSLCLAAAVKLSGKTLSELTSHITSLPQILINVSGIDKTKVNSNQRLSALVKKYSQELATQDMPGRILLRPSGTENLVRVMVEASEEETVNKIANHIAEVVKEELGINT